MPYFDFDANLDPSSSDSSSSDAAQQRGSLSGEPGLPASDTRWLREQPNQQASLARGVRLPAGEPGHRARTAGLSGLDEGPLPVRWERVRAVREAIARGDYCDFPHWAEILAKLEREAS